MIVEPFLNSIGLSAMDLLLATQAGLLLFIVIKIKILLAQVKMQKTIDEQCRGRKCEVVNERIK